MLYFLVYMTFCNGYSQRHVDFKNLNTNFETYFDKFLKALSRYHLDCRFCFSGDEPVARKRSNRFWNFVFK